MTQEIRILLVICFLGVINCGKSSGVKAKEPTRTGAPLLIVNNPFVDDHVSLSQDGSRAVFLSSRDFPQSNQILKFKSYRVSSADVTGGASSPSQVLAEDYGLEISAKISPSGEQIAVIVADHDSSMGHHLFIASFSGGGSPIEISFPQVGFLSNISFTADSKMLAVNLKPETEEKLAVYILDVEAVLAQGTSTGALKSPTSTRQGELLPIVTGSASDGYQIFSILETGSIVVRNFTSFASLSEHSDGSAIGVADFAAPSKFIAAPDFAGFLGQARSRRIDIQDKEKDEIYTSLPVVKELKSFDAEGAEMTFGEAPIALDIRGGAVTAATWPLSLVVTNGIVCKTAEGIKFFAGIAQLSAATAQPRMMYVYRRVSDGLVYFTADPCALTASEVTFDVGIFNMTLAAQSTYQSGILGFTAQIGADQETVVVSYTDETWTVQNISNNSP